MTHDDLIKHARRWLLRPFRRNDSWATNRGACSLVITDMTSASRETPDAIGWYGGNSVLVECKASISDFKADQRKFFRRDPEYGVGDWRYYLTPKGLLQVGQLPDGWGLLEASDTGRIFVRRLSEKFTVSIRDERHILLSLIRRLDVKSDGKHVKIRAYAIDDGRPPRATAVLNRKRTAE